MIAIQDLANALDEQLRIHEVADYAHALNGLQVTHRGPVTGIAAAVDVSLRTIDAAVQARANVLMVHHGLFWGGLQPLVGALHARVQRLIENDIALYASHLPLDLHPAHGNNTLLARALGLSASAGFAAVKGVNIGVRGDCDVATTELVDRVAAFSQPQQTVTRASAIPTGHRTRRWAMCSGSGASADTMREAVESGVDTLIVGEGPHWTAVDAPDHGLVIIYAGHYATETLGIKSIAEWAAQRFGLPWTFVDAPTGF